MAEFVDLSPEECARLLDSHHFGRVAVNGQDGLAIFPVNYTWDRGHVAIRTNPGSHVSDMAQKQVAFEIDRVDDEARTGWSVLVAGVAYEVTDSIDEVSEEMRDLPVDTWVPGEHKCWLRIEPRSITGRRVQPGAR